MSWIVIKLFIFDEIFAWKGFNKKSQGQGNSQNVSEFHDAFQQHQKNLTNDDFDFFYLNFN